MPIKSITTTTSPGFLIQVCAVCGSEHKISFGRGAQKSRKGPFSLQVGDTLEVAVDGGAPQTVTFAAGDFPNFAAVTASELITKLSAALTGVVAQDDAGGCLIESQAISAQSKVEVTGGTARAALGFPTDGRIDPSPGRPVLGISLGAPGDQLRDKNVVALRRCSDCGANECLIRTFDVASPEYGGTHFAEHRRSVNALAQHFKAQGWSHPDVASEHAAETAGPPDTDLNFPPGPSAPRPDRPRPEPPNRGGVP